MSHTAFQLGKNLRHLIQEDWPYLIFYVFRFIVYLFISPFILLFFLVRLAWYESAILANRCILIPARREESARKRLAQKDYVNSLKRNAQ